MLWIGALVFLLLAVADVRWITRRGDRIHAPGIGYGFAVSVLATLGVCATGVDWTLEAIVSVPYLMVASFALLPYGAFALLSRGPQWSYRLQWWGLALLVAVAAAVFGGYRLEGIRTNGWDFLQVPVLQLALAVAMHVLVAAVDWVRARTAKVR